MKLETEKKLIEKENTRITVIPDHGTVEEKYYALEQIGGDYNLSSQGQPLLMLEGTYLPLYSRTHS
jgi:hypothetical protein